jgi:hypothetical protein
MLFAYFLNMKFELLNSNFTYVSFITIPKIIPKNTTLVQSQNIS